MKAVMQTLLILMLAGLALTGCGQKGDLYLPASKPPVALPVEPVAEPAPTPPEVKPSESTQPDQQQSATASPDTMQQAQPSTSNTKR